MPDYLPNTDADLLAWAKNFREAIAADAASLSLTGDDVTEVKSLITAYEEAFNSNITKQAEARASRELKDSTRQNLEAGLRERARRVKATKDVTNEKLAALGLNAPDSEPAPKGAPQSRPVVSVDTSQRLQHTINWSDENSTSSRAKPKGVMGAEVWVKVGDAPPADESELRFLALDTATPYTAAFEITDGGKTAHYMLRWINTKGEKGAWSQTVSATITG